MSEQKTSLWEKWKVHTAFVAGALIISSVWGTCSYQPAVSSTEGDSEESTSTVESDVVTDAAVTTSTEQVTTAPVVPVAVAPATETATVTPVVTPTATVTVVAPASTVTVAKPATTTAK